MFQLNDGRVVDASTSIEYPAGILRPPGWIASLSAQEKAELGITDWTPPAYVPPVRPIDEAKEAAVTQLKQQTNDILSNSDWMVIRQAETGEQVPAEWEAYRTDVRDYSRNAERDINACSTVDELNEMVNLGFSWPLDPNAPPIDEFTPNETDIPLKRPDTPRVG